MKIPKLSEMNNEQKRIACAEECGFERIEGNRSWPHPIWVRPSDKVLLAESELPDYINDLNAICGAVSKLTDPQWRCYGSGLSDLSGLDYDWSIQREAKITNLPASVRLNAFLIATGRAEL